MICIICNLYFSKFRTNITEFIGRYEFLLNLTHKKYYGNWKSRDESNPSEFFENNKGLAQITLNKNISPKLDKVI